MRPLSPTLATALALLTAFFLALFLTGCGTKRQYFSPAQLSSEQLIPAELNSSLEDWNSYSARLADGSVLLQDPGANSGSGVAGLVLPPQYQLLLALDGEFFIADEDGDLKILNAQNEPVYESHFGAAVLGVGADGDDLALVLADNTIVLANRSLGVRFSQTLPAAPAQDSRFAAPIFTDTRIIYPTLDGRLIILSRATQRIQSDTIVSGESFFNNLIYLKMLPGSPARVLAATAKRAMIIPLNTTTTSPSAAASQAINEDIKDILLAGDAIYIFNKSGQLIRTDLALRVQARLDFDFAIFTKVSLAGDFIYAFEKTGYLLKISKDLKNYTIYKIAQAEGELAFLSGRNFYFKNKILTLP